MYISLILFLIALLGITIMIVRKYFSIKHIEIKHTNDLNLEFEVPDLEEIQEAFGKKTKKLGYFMLVYIIRLYVISGTFLKEKTLKIYKKISNKIFKNKKINNPDNNEVSPFIQTIKAYKKKVQRITHKIKQEEGIK